MAEKYLTLEQNLCAARIFLNTFGFILEDVNNIDEFSKIQIYDKKSKVVGELYFDNGKVVISAKYSKCKLLASYDIAKMIGFCDIECGNALFGQWSSTINFQIENDKNVNINGEFLIGNAADTEFGISCLCHPLINCEIPNKGNITIKILRDGQTFGLEIVSEDYIEKISVMPWDDLNGFILHDIKKGKYNKEQHGYPYRKYAGIFNGAERGEYKDDLHVFLKEEEMDNRLNFRSEFIPKVGNDESSEALIQKGLLMQELDESYTKRISELRKILLIDGISLLDNLISVCYDSYSDEELNALLGIKREKMIYQDGANNLVESYFGIGKNSQFLSLEQQRRLLKNKNMTSFAR